MTAPSPSSPMSAEALDHERAFFGMARAFFVDIVKAKVGLNSARANDLLHKLDHVEKLLAATPEAPGDVAEIVRDLRRYSSLKSHICNQAADTIERLSAETADAVKANTEAYAEFRKERRAKEAAEARLAEAMKLASGIRSAMEILACTHPNEWHSKEQLHREFNALLGEHPPGPVG
jgi:hypothetical protein